MYFVCGSRRTSISVSDRESFFAAAPSLARKSEPITSAVTGSLDEGSVWLSPLDASTIPLLRFPPLSTRPCPHHPTTAVTTSSSTSREPPVHSAIRTQRGRRRFWV